MIAFQSIRYTTAGLECYYLGQRTSGDQVLHRFAIVNPTCETFAYFNDQGQRIEYVAPGKWAVTLEGHQIVKPPKIVEVTRWVALYSGNIFGDGYFVRCYDKKPELQNDTLGIQQHTFRFEVPHD